MHSEKMGDLTAALVNAQKRIKGAAKSASNPHLKNQYSTLADVTDACRDALTANGLAVTQTFEAQDDAGITVVTTLHHVSGQWIRSALRMPLEKPTAQAVGSAITYARRYGLAAMVGVVPVEDDDGNAASAAAPAQARPASPNRASPNHPKPEWGGKAPGEKVMPFGKHKGQKLAEIDRADLESTIAWCEAKDADKFADLIAACRAVLHPAAAFATVPAALEGPEEGDDELPF